MQHLLSLGTQGNPKPSWKELAFPDSVSRQGAIERKSTVLWEATRPSRCSCQLLDWILWPGKEDRAGGKGESYRRSRDFFKGIKLCVWNYTVGCPPFLQERRARSGPRKGVLSSPPLWDAVFRIIYLFMCLLCGTHIHVACAYTHICVPCAHSAAPTSVYRVHTMQHAHSCAMHAKFDLGLTSSVFPLTRAEELTPPGPGPPLMVITTVLGCFYWASIAEQARKIIFFLFPACPSPPHTHCTTLVR